MVEVGALKELYQPQICDKKEQYNHPLPTMSHNNYLDFSAIKLRGLRRKYVPYLYLEHVCFHL